MTVTFSISNVELADSPPATSMTAIQVLPRLNEIFQWKGVRYNVDYIFYDYDANNIVVFAHKSLGQASRF